VRVRGGRRDAAAPAAGWLPQVKKKAQTQQALEARRVQLERASVTAAQAQAIAPRSKATRIGAMIPRVRR
jgi:hypothetical protein